MKHLLFSLAAIGLMARTALAQDVCAPAQTTTLATTGFYATILVSWIATGDDCATGNAATYEIRVSTSSFTEANWQTQSTQLTTGSSAANGNQNTECMTVSPCATTTYYFAVFVVDEAGNRSPMSAVVVGAARCQAPFVTC